jgi:hypothetical protein
MTLEKTAEVANAKLAEIKAANEVKQKEEARGASTEPKGNSSLPKDEEIKKTKAEEKDDATKAREQAESEAKKDETLLNTTKEDASNLSDEDKKRRNDLFEKKKAKWQEGVDKRIGELHGTIKDMKTDKSQDKETIAKLQAELNALQNKVEPPQKTAQELSKKAEQERTAKYLEEDANKDREQRREMSNDDLDDWFLEDPRQAAEWVGDRSVRRAREMDIWSTDQYNDERMKELIRRQSESAKTYESTHPELVVEDRVKELQSQGMDKKTIHDTICKENEKYRICSEILHENGKELLSKPNAPELIVAEMEKRLSKEKPKSKEGKYLSEEDIEQIKNDAIQTEIERQSRVDETLTSSGRKKAEGKQSDFSKVQEALAIKAGISPERLKDMNKRRAGIPGASVR